MAPRPQQSYSTHIPVIKMFHNFMPTWDQAVNRSSSFMPIATANTLEMSLSKEQVVQMLDESIEYRFNNANICSS
jgi:hypothetical protein